MEREKITLVCTTLGKNPELLRKMFISAEGFDDFILHIDQDKWPPTLGHPFKQIARVISEDHLDIPTAYNELIKNVKTEWVCCFCDDDYFYPEGLFKMIAEVHNGIDADVAHFKFHVSGHCPKEDYRAWLLGKEYDLWESRPITQKLLQSHNRLPAGSFFRKSAWEKAGGFQGSKFHDWDLWKRMALMNCKFKYFPHLVYNMVRRPNSAWHKQMKEIS